MNDERWFTLAGRYERSFGLLLAQIGNEFRGRISLSLKML
jgi:hypothetical protein